MSLIILSVSVVICVIVVSVLAYQMLLVINECNKRLLFLTSESINYARDTYEDVLAKIESMQVEVNESRSEKNTKDTVVDDMDDTGFDPHSYGKGEVDL